MAKKKKTTDPAQKARITAVHGLLAKSGPMKHKNDKRVDQKNRRYDQENG